MAKNDLYQWLKTATYSQVIKVSSYCPFSDDMPTCLYPDGKTLYVSSVGELVDITKIEEIEDCLGIIVHHFRLPLNLSIKTTAKEYLKLGILRKDFNALALYIYKMMLIDPYLTSRFDVEYGSPDDAFEEIYTKLSN